MFQERFRAIEVRSQEQLKNNFVYISTNPVEIVEPGWKNWKVKNPGRAIKFLEQGYKWSSYPDFIGRKNFSSLIKLEFFTELLGGKKGITKEVESWIRFKNEVFQEESVLREIAFE